MIDCLKVTSDRKMFLVVSYNSPFVCTEKKKIEQDSNDCRHDCEIITCLMMEAVNLTSFFRLYISRGV